MRRAEVVAQRPTIGDRASTTTRPDGNTIAFHDDPYGLECMTKGLIASLLVAGSLVVWLRRGAPVSVPRDDGAGYGRRRRFPPRGPVVGV